MKRHGMKKLNRSAVALEYILIAALLAMGVVVAFVSMRGQMEDAMGDIGETTVIVVADQTSAAKEASSAAKK